MTRTILSFLFLLGTINLTVSQNINLSGKWEFALDSLEIGEKEGFFNKTLSQVITLPGTTDEAKIGIKHIPGSLLYVSDKQPEIWGLARNYKYIGKAWYQKQIEVPEAWSNKQIVLELERVMWQSKLWVNGHFAGEQHSLCTPQLFDIGAFLMPGKNTLTLSVDNSPFVHLGSWSHGYSPGIQSIWNGIVGEIKLHVNDAVHLANIQLYPSLKDRQVKVRGLLVGNSSPLLKGSLHFDILDKDNSPAATLSQNITLENDSVIFETTIPLNGELLTWDEFAPNLYQLKLKSDFAGYSDQKVLTFGLRDIEVQGNNILINGNKVFMRGENDAGSFPLSGYPSMEKADWLQIFKTGKEYGFNHWRFHSWCPPKAAFEAADELGMYLQPELPLFSQNWENTLVGADAERDAFLFGELKKILEVYGNHPSFVFMCMGNELKGDAGVLEKWVNWGKKHDPRHFYLGTTNLEAMGLYEKLSEDEIQVAHAGQYQGKRAARRMYAYFNSEIPNTSGNYSHTLEPPFDAYPIISHEVGQWEVYPDFSETESYTGVFSARNFEIFKSRLDQKGMLVQAPDFVSASGKLSALLYREEMERLLRTPGMAGYQLLGLRDYQAQGSALVGMVNALGKPKSFVTAEEFRQSNNAVCLLLESRKRTWLNNEILTADLLIPNYGPATLNNIRVNWKVINGEKVLATGFVNCEKIPQGELQKVGNLSFDLASLGSAAKISIKLSAPELGIGNTYDFWVYPAKIEEQQSDEIRFATKASPALLDSIKNGASVLLLPSSDQYDAERMTFTTPFWSTILFSYQVKTMGILCDPQHPVFNSFPTDFYTNWQWWELTHNAFAARLNQSDRNYRPLVQVIDHPVRNDKLGAIVETKIGKGKLLVCTFDILSAPDARPVARQLKHSILEYMRSEAFNPPVNIGIKEAFFNYASAEAARYKSIGSTDEDPGHPAFFAFDGSTNTTWQTATGNAYFSADIEFSSPRYIVGCSIQSASLSGRLSVYISDDKDQMGEPVIYESGELNREFDAKTWDNGFTLQLGKKGKYARIVIEPEAVVPNSGIAEFNWIFGD